ncbi:MAG TPA: acyltransferase [Cyclobacteriaceae bacterium]|nr:acyltransferase [Cyclobacteriaceae bacterium]
MSEARRYDIDWIRVIAIGLLLIYHVAIAFQPWGVMIGFPTNKEAWTGLWIPMTMLNIWRIPLLFFVSGMGVYFALKSRTLKELYAERSLRIFVPYVFGMFVIVPIHTYLWRYYFNMQLIYTPSAGHLWFLGNIFIYVLVLTPLFMYMKTTTWVKKVFGHPAGVLIVIGAFVLEQVIIKPVPYELYANTWHGFVLGMLAFFFGFCFVLAGATMLKGRWIFATIAIGLFVLRLNGFQQLLVVESQCWIFSVLGFGYKYLNRGSNALTYLAQAAYPVYILHMIFLYLGALLIFPLSMPVQLKFVTLLIFTLMGCMLTYEYVVRRIKWIRPLFGLRFTPTSSSTRDSKLQPSETGS